MGRAVMMAVNMQARMLHAPYVRSFEGFDRPWNHLEQLLDDVHVRELAFGSGYVLTGRSSGPGGLTLGSYSARPDRGPPNPAQVATFNLRALQDTNEVLFYRLVSDHIEEMLPVLYTPTVGLACQRFSEMYRRPRGLFIAYPDRDRIGEILRNRPRREVDVIVVTDGQRILGLGDQGIGGMGIPIGKLSLYAVLGGIDPARTLPVLLDVGTDNAGLLDDPMYLGWRHRRVAGAGYDDFIDRFVQAVRAELPGVLLQWEDFATPHALPILERYRDQLLSFNDDIQGTAAVVLAALSAGAAATGSRLRDQRVVMLGGVGWHGVCEQGGWMSWRWRRVPGSACPLPPGPSPNRSCAASPRTPSGRSSCRCPIRPAAARPGRKISPTGPKAARWSPPDPRSRRCGSATPASPSPSATTSSSSPESAWP